MMGWKFTGGDRPSFAIEPGPGQESVWDYPRPPALVNDQRRVIVSAGDFVIAETTSTVRVLETASPPTVYIPQADVNFDHLVQAAGQSFCEWKGSATYWSVQTPQQLIKNAGWSYASPSERFKQIDGYLSFYPGKVSCFVDGELVRPQAGDFYGGWVTDEIVGPFKGDPGTGGW